MISQYILSLAVYLPKPKSLPNSPATSATIANIFHAVLATFGAIAVLIMALAGFKYVMSRGDPGATAKAKDTILYALVGLIVSIAAYAIVSFVVPKVTS